METGNVPKRQQPDHRADNSRRSPTGLQCNKKLLHPEVSFSLFSYRTQMKSKMGDGEGEKAPF